MTWPCQPVDWDAYNRFGSAGEALRWYISQPANNGPSTSQSPRVPSDVRMKAPFRVPTRSRTPLIDSLLVDLERPFSPMTSSGLRIRPRQELDHRAVQKSSAGRPFPRPGAREEDGQKALAGLDAATVGVATIGVCGCVAPVALDLPALAADCHEPVEGPRALVCVLGALLVVPSVELRVGQHLAELMPADVRKGRKALAMAEAGEGPRNAARIVIEGEGEAEPQPNTVHPSWAVTPA